MAKSSLISLVSSNSVDFWLWIIFECRAFCTGHVEIITIIILVCGAEDWNNLWTDGDEEGIVWPCEC